MTSFVSPSRRSLLKASIASGAAIAFAAASSGCTNEDQSTKSLEEQLGIPVPKGQFTIGIARGTGSDLFDPNLAITPTNLAVNWHVFEGLTQIHPSTREAIPALANQLLTDNAIAFDVHLRDGAVFHDGTPVTPDDVVFSIERAIDPNTPNHYRELFAFIQSATTIADNSLRITLKETTKAINERFALLKILPQAAVEKDPAGFFAAPIGSGPWKLEDTGIDSGAITFAANTEYSGSLPARFETMTWTVVDPKDVSTRLSDGTIQAVVPAPFAEFDQLKEKFTGVSRASVAGVMALFNMTSSSAFSEIANRSAFLHSVDWMGIVTKHFGGYGDHVASANMPSNEDFKRAAPVYAFDINRARASFEATQLKEFTLLTSDEPWMIPTAEYLRDELAAIGVTANIKAMPYRELAESIGAPGAVYDVALMPFDHSHFGTQPDTILLRWFASQLWAGERTGWTKSPKYQRMLDAIAAAAKPAVSWDDQHAAWNEAFDLAAQEAPLYPLFYYRSLTAYIPEAFEHFEASYAMTPAISTAIPR